MMLKCIIVLLTISSSINAYGSYIEVPIISNQPNVSYLSISKTSSRFVFSSFKSIVSVFVDGSTAAFGSLIESDEKFTNSVSCWTHMDMCLVSGYFEANVYRIDVSNSTASPKLISQIRMVSPTPNFTVTRTVVQAIDYSDYLLFGSFKEMGIVRAHYTSRSTWAQLDDLSDLPDYAMVLGFVILPGTEFALVNYDGVKTIYKFHVGLMTPSQVSKITFDTILTGRLNRIGVDPSSITLSSTRERSLSILDIDNVSVLKNYQLDFLITHSVSFPRSNYIAVSDNRNIYIMNPFVSSAILDKIFHGRTLRSFDYLPDKDSNGFIIVGDGTASIYLNHASTSNCHQACATCTQPFSDYHCSSCSGGYQTVGDLCLKEGVDPSSSYIQKYSGVEWIDDNKYGFYYDKSAFTKKYNFIVSLCFIGFIALIVSVTTVKNCLLDGNLWVSCFSCLCCCCKKNEEPEVESDEEADKEADDEEESNKNNNDYVAAQLAEPQDQSPNDDKSKKEQDGFVQIENEELKNEEQGVNNEAKQEEYEI